MTDHVSLKEFARFEGITARLAGQPALANPYTTLSAACWAGVSTQQDLANMWRGWMEGWTREDVVLRCESA
jgi:hypothetical protein